MRTVCIKCFLTAMALDRCPDRRVRRRADAGHVEDERPVHHRGGLERQHAGLLRQSDLQDAQPGPLRHQRRSLRLGVRAGRLLQSLAQLVSDGTASAHEPGLEQQPGNGQVPAARHGHPAGVAQEERLLHGRHRQVLPHGRIRREATAVLRPHRELRQAAGMGGTRSHPQVPVGQERPREILLPRTKRARNTASGGPAVPIATAIRAWRPKKKATTATHKSPARC